VDRKIVSAGEGSSLGRDRCRVDIIMCRGKAEGMGKEEEGTLGGCHTCKHSRIGGKVLRAQMK
jgi:hypothetical protein